MGAIEEKMPRAALAGIDDELSDRLPEQFAHGLADHFVSDVEGIDVNHFAAISLDTGQSGFAFRALEMIHRRNHKRSNLPYGGNDV